MDGTDLTDADIVRIVTRETSERELSDAAFKTVDRYHTLLLQAADPDNTFIPTEVIEGVLGKLRLDGSYTKKPDRDDDGRH